MTYTGYYDKNAEIVCTTCEERIAQLKRHIKLCTGKPAREHMLPTLYDELHECEEFMNSGHQ